MTDKKEIEEENENNCGWKAYQKIKNALDGLYEILSLSFDEDNVLYQCGLDNLERLKETIVDVLTHDYDSKEIQYKLRELEYGMKHSLFFEEEKEKAKKTK
ncbi:MAG: hypothetical protein BAJALOKI1v1_440011 [Promethearchaeota archaeon]|nr:MAG: hypothetical protein BAJALOKI1v1_440011 [Candidatus Lokiarchaeota archaeon]